MIIILAVYHGVIALWGYDTDERDRLIELKAERIAAHARSGSLLIIVGWVMAKTFDPNVATLQPLLVVVWMFAAMTLAEGIKYVAQIIYYRAGA